ncbi:asparagine synthase-related protein [Streptomyces sp. G-G2]|uniref:asparagine synthase-related protein n=1 Tax=Streptomyces sp. G-G2 TaxID=3046201 RepID=UPI0024BABF03|nr:asparagine synthase-related protein [Streptomyces sp. G-G2]MDJ0383236.1 asparagine synthase-related protein [Streptomyces sp. G-G2]
MRFVAGIYDTGRDRAPGSRWRPCARREIAMEGPGRIWYANYTETEVRSSPALGGTAEVIAIGSCLATASELREARDAAERGNTALAARLPGAYLSVVRTADTVRVAGDRAGTVSAFWIVDGDEVLWSTSALVLAAYAGSSPSLDRLLASFTVHRVDPLGGRHSYFDGISRVPPGRALVLEPGRLPRTEPVTPSVSGLLSFEEGAEALADRVTTAVVRRMALYGKTSTDVSGGIDSSAVTAVASNRAPVLAITYTDRQMAAEDDLLYARRLAGDLPGIQHAMVDGSALGVKHFDRLDSVTKLPLTDSPSLSLGVLAIKAAHLEPALAYGSRAHLTGRGGDDVLDAVPTTNIDLFHSGHRSAAARDTGAFARARQRSVLSVLTEAARTARTTYPQALTRLAEELERRSPLALRPGPMAWCGATAAAAWLTAGGRSAVAALVDDAARRADLDIRPGVLHERLALERMGEEHATFDDIARQRWGLPVHAPYLDSLVVDACHAVPGWERSRPGDFKPLARAAFSAVMPAYGLNRRTKTAHTQSVYAGLRANAAALTAIIKSSALAQAGLIDPVRAVAALEAAVRGEPAPLAGLHSLIAIERWRAAVPIRRELFWEQAPAAKEAA